MSAQPCQALREPNKKYHFKSFEFLYNIINITPVSVPGSGRLGLARADWPMLQNSRPRGRRPGGSGLTSEASSWRIRHSLLVLRR